jgi:hypothetical protein
MLALLTRKDVVYCGRCGSREHRVRQDKLTSVVPPRRANAAVRARQRSADMSQVDPDLSAIDRAVDGPSE